MKKIMISFILMISCSVIKVSAIETYCSITHDIIINEIYITPNFDYMTESYWHYILYNNDGSKRKFDTLENAINHLATFDWYVSRYESNGKIK